MEYWGAQDYGRPPAGAVTFKFKMDTDLYDLAKAKTRPCSISFSPDGKSMAVTARDKQVMVMVKKMVTTICHQKTALDVFVCIGVLLDACVCPGFSDRCYSEAGSRSTTVVIS